MKKTMIIALLLILAFFAYLDPVCAASGTVTQLRPITVRDMGGYPLVGLMKPMWTDAIVLAAGVAQSYTIPTGATMILFSSSMGCDFYVNYTTTAAVPGASTSTGLAAELNPTLRGLGGATSISLISATAGIVTVSLFK